VRKKGEGPALARGLRRRLPYSSSALTEKHWQKRESPQKQGEEKRGGAQNVIKIPRMDGQTGKQGRAERTWGKKKEHERIHPQNTQKKTKYRNREGQTGQKVACGRGSRAGKERESFQQKSPGGKEEKKHVSSGEWEKKGTGARKRVSRSVPEEKKGKGTQSKNEPDKAFQKIKKGLNNFREGEPQVEKSKAGKTRTCVKNRGIPGPSWGH